MDMYEEKEKPRGIWVPICFIWPVIGKVFLIPIFLLFVGFIAWAFTRIASKLPAEIDEYPLVDLIEFFACLSG
jgi:hypothetical protein